MLGVCQHKACKAEKRVTKMFFIVYKTLPNVVLDPRLPGRENERLPHAPYILARQIVISIRGDR